MKKDMTPFEERFYSFLRLNPLNSTFLAFAASVWGRKMSEELVKERMELIDSVELIGVSQEDLLSTLFFLNNEDVEAQEPRELLPFEIRHLGIRLSKAINA